MAGCKLDSQCDLIWFAAGDSAACNRLVPWLLIAGGIGVARPPVGVMLNKAGRRSLWKSREVFG
jgi:hypothetical protein